MSIVLKFRGAAGCVTGACFEIETRQATVLVDCGLFQGAKTLKALNYRALPFEAAKVHAVLLTHAHIDHSGLLPKLALDGFAGPIFATAGTAALCRVLLPDAGAIQEMEVEALNRRRNQRGDDPVEPIYTAKDAEACMQQFRTAGLRALEDVAPGIRARFWPAGHILGSTSIEVEIDDADGPIRLLFSGDIGPGGRDVSQDPEGPSGVDHLVLESTYGDVERAPVTPEQRRAILADEVRQAHASGGPLIIPAFAVERTQELIADLLELIEQNRAPPGLIFLDSPLAIRACEIFLREGRLESGLHPFEDVRESRILRFTESVAESRGIERMKGWHMVIAGSGMCDAGRIRHHLKRLLWNADATVLLCGFQAVGTLGRLLQEGRTHVTIQGEPVRVRARVRSVDVYSGHADANGLVAWAKARAPVGGRVFLAHGEPPNLKGLSRRLAVAGVPQASIVVPDLDQGFRLRRTEALMLADAPRIPPEAAARLDWHNARAALLCVIDERLRAAPSDEARASLLSAWTEKVAG